MSKQYLAEGLKGSTPFIVNRDQALQAIRVMESLPNGKQGWRISGILSEVNKLNGNGRKYPEAVWKKQVAEGSTLTRLISSNDCLGQLEHPADGVITYNSPISHMVTAVKLNENGTVTGDIVLFDTLEGQRIKSMIEAGHNPKVSSRGFGSVIHTNGYDEVCDDYVCEGWDIVMKPSFESAIVQPTPALDAVLGRKNESQPLPESAEPKPALTPAPVVPAQTAEATPSAEQTPTNTKNNMKISEARSQVAALKSTKPADIKEASDVLSKVSALHTAIDEALVNEPTQAYTASKLHTELEGIEAGIVAASTAPSQEVTKLKENLNKALGVIKALVETAQKYKTGLAEANKSKAEQQKLIEGILGRARKWVQIAESRKDAAVLNERKYGVACESLDDAIALYNADTALLGGRVLTLEFGEKITPEVAKKISEAKNGKTIADIRESLEGKTKTAPAAPAPAAPAKTAPVEPAKTPVAEAKKPEEAPQFVETERKFDITESIETAKRLSAATK